MPTLTAVLSDVARLREPDAEWVHRLVADWAVIADLSFADLLLWVPRADDAGWVCAAHVRPATGPNVFDQDMVGTPPGERQVSSLDQARDTGGVVHAVEGSGGVRLLEDYLPVVHSGSVIAVVSRHVNPETRRVFGILEEQYAEVAARLCRMLTRAEFPSPGAPTAARRAAPRVGDGVIRLDAHGSIEFASPNAVSALRRLGHRGTVVGADLAEAVTTLLTPGVPVDESLPLVVTGRAPWHAELEVAGGSASLRAIPLTEFGERVGALVLVRDISEIRRRERELLTKDATIREIHHRVKNNLQTVAALLRLQGRRLEDPVARQALADAERRITTVATVHETLSSGLDETVEFDQVASTLARYAAEAATREGRVEVTLSGRFGRLRAEDANALAMVIAELTANAVEHGLAQGSGHVTLSAERSGPDDDGRESLVILVADDGAGLPEGFSPRGKGLGLQIVQALVQDLKGTIVWEPNEPRGTRVRVTCRLRRMDGGRGA